MGGAREALLEVAALCTGPSSGLRRPGSLNSRWSLLVVRLAQDCHPSLKMRTWPGLSQVLGLLTLCRQRLRPSRCGFSICENWGGRSLRPTQGPGAGATGVAMGTSK